MFSSKSDIIIERSPEDVFEFISHLENDPLWCPEVRVVNQSDDSPPSLGKTYEMMARPIPEDQWGGYEIVEFEPPTRMKIRLWQGSSQGITTYHLEPTDGGTRLTYLTEVELSRPRRLFEPLVGWLTTKQRGPRMLNNLKLLLEQDSN